MEKKSKKKKKKKGEDGADYKLDTSVVEKDDDKDKEHTNSDKDR